MRFGVHVADPYISDYWQQDHFYGERSGTVRDPFGHEWLLGGHLETVEPDEMQRRYSALFQK
jgi:hypothetical protein